MDATQANAADKPNGASPMDENMRNRLAMFLAQQQDAPADYASSAPGGNLRPYTNGKNLNQMQQYGQPVLTPMEMLNLERQINQNSPQAGGVFDWKQNVDARNERMLPKDPMTYPDSHQSLSFERFMSPHRPTPRPWGR